MNAAEILVLQYRSKESERLFEQMLYKRLEAELPVTVRCIHAWDSTVEWLLPEVVIGDARAVILGGSGDLFFEGDGTHAPNAEELFATAQANTEPTIKHLVAQDFPTLGICFGHQVLANGLGVTVGHDTNQAKTGTHTVALTSEGRKDKIFGLLPEQFDAQYGHKDSLTEIPFDAVLLARGETCKYSAYRYRKNIYSVQFHPELTKEDTLEKIKRNQSFLPQNANETGLVRETPHATELLRLFVAHYAQ